MTKRDTSLLCGALLCGAFVLACVASPASAGHYRRARHAADWYATHWAIYRLNNRIAYLEANPQTDDGYRAPIITRARADISRLRTTLWPAQWRWWPTPCCYSRQPIHIR